VGALAELNCAKILVGVIEEDYVLRMGLIWNPYETLIANQEKLLAGQVQIIGLLKQLLKGETAMSIDLTKIQAEIAANTSVTQSVVTLVNTLATEIKNIPPSNDPQTQAALDSLVATLQANDQTLAAAVAANTPADSNPTPPSGG